MELNYNLGLFLNDYLDKLKSTVLLSKNFQNTAFYTQNKNILAKILFLAWQKGLAQNEVYDIVNYVFNDDRVLTLIYDYKGYTNYDILIRAVAIIFNVEIIRDGENFVGIDIGVGELTEQAILQSQDLQQIIFNDTGLSSLLLGTQLPAILISFIKLFLPAGIQLDINISKSTKEILRDKLKDKIKNKNLLNKSNNKRGA
ncbi:MAG: hypothetical protein FWE18_00220 [Alphaproteobacteria bacterium]|nr:hypothetical protein [Alphaproteobacteria bacterium]